MFILTAFAAYMLTIPALIILVVLGVLSETNDSHKWAVFFGISAITVAYFLFEIPLLTLAIAAAVYVPVGLAWSRFRYQQVCNTAVSAWIDRFGNNRRNDLARSLKPSSMLSEITSWVVAWPFSMIRSVTGDVVNMIQSLITGFFKGVYARVFSNAMSRFDHIDG